MTQISSPVWRLNLLGELKLCWLGDSRLAPATHFRSRKTAALLAFLALRRGAHRRESLSDLLWPETETKDARNSLRVALSALRALTEPEGVVPGTVLVVSRESVALSLALTTDVEAFECALSRARADHNPITRYAAFESAVNLYGGRLTALDEAEWLVGEDDRLEDNFVTTIEEMVKLIEGQGETTTALSHAQDALQKAPLREEIALEVLRLSLATGVAEATRDFKKWCARAQKQGISVEHQTLRRAHAHNTRNAVATQHQTASPHLPRIHGLHPSLTKFFSRESEVVALHDKLKQGARLVTLTGPGGVGKTRLALQAAQRMGQQKVADFDLVVWLSLADLPVASLIPAVLAQVLGIARKGSQWPTSAMALRQKKPVRSAGRTLLILDGFEHLCDDGAPLVREWLKEMPELTCCLVSRRSLGFAGEVRQEVLPFETVVSPAISGETDQSTPAMELFLDRARLARPEWEITPKNRQIVAQICNTLQGLPLAIEIAASRLALFTAAQILAEIEASHPHSPFSFADLRGALEWKNPDRAAPPRHATLRTCIAWSERQLPTAAARFWAQISVFSGGFGVEAASEICECDATPLILALGETSLLRLDARGESVRAVQLEIARQYAAQLLTETESAIYQERHARYYAQWIESSVNNSQRIQSEWHNLKRALQWFLCHEPNSCQALQQALKSHIPL